MNNFKLNWSKYPRLGAIITKSPGTEIYGEELRGLLNEARNDSYMVGFTYGQKHSTTIRKQVVEFHNEFKQPILGYPQVPSDERVRLRLRLIAEEFFELLDAALLNSSTVALPQRQMEHVMHAIDNAPIQVDLVELADAMADLDYVVEGTRLEFGINGADVAAEVHRSNMSKKGATVRADGKIVKPATYSPPDIASVLKNQGWVSK